MATITVYFVGICTHVRTQGTMAAHDVLLVNAWNRDRINGHDIDAHEARLWLNARQRLPLKGVSITVNSAKSGVTYDATFESCVERARDYAPVDQLTPDDEALHPRRLGKLAATFTCGGHYSGGIDDHGASVAKVEIDTGDAAPVLTITPFGSDTSQDIELENGAILQLENLGRTAKDDHDYDFLLHYRVGTSIPADVKWPEKRKPCSEMVIPYPHNTVGPGCANSTYP
jgi:hypothetical protein